jgi:hypothetical protein
MLMGFKKAGLLTLIILVSGLIVVVLITQDQTQTRQNASGTVNLNQQPPIFSDNSKGPDKSSRNYSSLVKKENLGSLTFAVSNTSKVSIKNFVIKVKKVEVFLESSDKSVKKWETLDMMLPISIDLVQLSDKGVANLSLTNLSFGKYSKVRVYIENAVLVLGNGKTQKLTIDEKDKVVRVVKDFTIEKGKNTNIILDFNAEKSFLTSDGKYFLIPFVSDILINK